MVERRLIQINGIVQGVGFRPFVFNSAVEFNLKGFVKNTAGGVEIEVEGSKKAIGKFTNRLESKPPPLSIITEMNNKLIPMNGDLDFTIKATNNIAEISTLISPDVAVCKDCLEELFDPNDKRFHYPFINCTNCGPRFTIIKNIPYDRQWTTMKKFKMCQDCQAEYDDPLNRRFHAQPNACPICGPKVTLHDSNRKTFETDDPIAKSAALLKEGFILTIKGLGGFHLAVDATNEKAVSKLRERKGREEKPFAIMVKDLNTTHELCYLSGDEENALISQQSPILLLKRKNMNSVAKSVAPNNKRLGVMLPYTPLHHLLMNQGIKTLVMTSANFSEEPICIDNNEAFTRLKKIADYFLTHNRDIYLRSDDSVMIQIQGALRHLRRSRGFTPTPIFVDSVGPPVLSLGGELKNTVCLLKENKAFLSQYIGDLENLEVYDFFQLTIDHLQRIFDTKPEIIVHDLHPRYFSTQWAKKQNKIETLGVQHHHAHLASCMAENNLNGPVIGFIMDGTGYGTDKTIWGGEVLIGGYGEYQRYAHFQKMPLPGGNAAIKAPWKTAVSYLFESFREDIPELPFLKNQDIKPIIEILTKKVNSPLTSSCGRLFDAVAAMSGGRQTIHYEAQTAIEFMQAANGLVENPFEFEILENGDHNEILISPLIHSIVDAIQSGENVHRISGRFHYTLIKIFLEITLIASKETQIKDIVLSGGVFQNDLLFNGLMPELKKKGFNVYSHSQVPTNDGGLSLGQAMIGRHYLIDKEVVCA